MSLYFFLNSVFFQLDFLAKNVTVVSDISMMFGTFNVVFVVFAERLLACKWMRLNESVEGVKSFSHLSIWDRNLVSKMPLVLSVSEICPRKRNPRLVRSINICLTISPRYMPLHIFSYLPHQRQRSAMGNGRTLEVFVLLRASRSDGLRSHSSGSQ